MVLRADQDRICKLIKDTLTLLCKNGLTFDLEFSIDALIGVTLDKNDVFLVKIDEQVKSEKAKRAEQEAADAAERADQVESYGDTDSESDAGSGSRKRGLSGAAQRKKRRKMMEENQENGQSDDDETHDQDSRTDQHRVKQEDGEGDNVIVIKEEMDDSWQGDDFTGQFSLPGTSTQEPNFSTQDANFPSLADMTFTPVGQDTSQVWAQSTAYASPSSMGRGRPSVGSSQLDPSQEVIDELGRVRYKCAECEVVVSSKTNLYSHQRLHAGIYSYYCPECDKGFGSTTTLRSHLRTHNIDVFRCDSCEMTFEKMRELNEHTMNGNHINPYKRRPSSPVP